MMYLPIMTASNINTTIEMIIVVFLLFHHKFLLALDVLAENILASS